MLTLRYGDCFSNPCVLLLGGFDGLHKGHVTLLNRAKQYGFPVGIMTIEGGKAGGDLFTLAEREHIFSAAGLEFMIRLSFSEIKSMLAEDFLKGLFQALSLKAVVCGEDFRFGYGATGDRELLKKFSPCPVEILPIKKSNGEKIATSELKKLLANGRVACVNDLIEGTYFIQGFAGERVEIDAETAWYVVLVPKEKYLPAEGFYVSEIVCGGIKNSGILAVLGGNITVFVQKECRLSQGDTLSICPKKTVKSCDFTHKNDILKNLHSIMRDIIEGLYD